MPINILMHLDVAQGKACPHFGKRGVVEFFAQRRGVFHGLTGALLRFVGQEMDQKDLLKTGLKKQQTGYDYDGTFI